MGELLLIMLAFIIFSKSIGCSEAAGCIERERQALLSFKHGILDKGNFLSSWTSSSNEDCCKWIGIKCDNKTGHVITLDLSPVTFLNHPNFGNEIGSSLLELQYLKHLDLSVNNFTRIPNFIGSFTSLNYLNLSYNYIVGTIPSRIGNLTKLRVLDLRGSILMIESLHWLPHLSSLRILRFEDTNFTKAVDWLQSIKLASSLSSLELSYCEFPRLNTSFLSHMNSSNSLKYLSVSGYGIHPTIIPWLLNVSLNLVNLTLNLNYDLRGLLPNSFANMSSLEHIDLSHNSLQGGLPKSLGNLCNLKVLLLNDNELNGTLNDHLGNLSRCVRKSVEILNLSDNQLGGSVPDMEAFPSLRELYLADNQLEGHFPFSLSQIQKLAVLHLHHNLLTGSLPDLSKLSFLRELRVGQNKLNGSLPESIGQLSNLEILDISSNYFTGIVSKSHLQNLLKLQILDLSFNSLTLNFESNGILPRTLYILKLNSCKMGPRFPSWLRTQLNLSYLDISDAGISDVIPDWFYPMASKLVYLNLSFNHVNGTLQNFPAPLSTIDLSSNLFQGTIPVSLSNAQFINLSHNKFTRFRSFVCSLTDMIEFLDISYNMLTGRFPDCRMDWRVLCILNLESNNLSGILPSSLSSLYSIQTLRLSNNSFSGIIPLLQNCSNLQFLDLGNNKLSGSIPTWIGQSLKILEVLRLKSNKLNGRMPSNLCSLSYLKILDLSLNHISGEIPPCIQNLTSMAYNEQLYPDDIYLLAFPIPSSFGYEMFEISSADKAKLMWKGIEYPYEKIPEQLKMIDLSCNALVGEIPRGLTNLVALVQLNLSRNSLNGTIPKKIGQLHRLESLDLSHNQLSEEIPSSLTNISSLSVMDLSYNQLSGRIPTGTQLQSFNASSYEENRGLCGPPLTSMCPGDETSHPPSHSAGGKSDFEDGGLWFDVLWFYIGIGIGFNFAFWGVCGTLLINTSWRRTYFGFLSNFRDFLYVTISIKWNKLKRRIQG
ncbi:receptor-like protein EIX2 [Ziziphus jujuba]|uniref:Receptor-like protein EIX2 n=1 Tax=Ziziphus jujuba TaxID=326968 RepID=A0ABM3IPX9_ZIZJJ|nr:receptor-like protein EIX2 [Ziziphus jujuba]